MVAVFDFAVKNMNSFGYRRNFGNSKGHSSAWLFFLALFLNGLISWAANTTEHNTLQNYQISANRINVPLTPFPGDALRGRAIVAGRDGNCLACHSAPIPEQQFHGNLGPDLSEVGSYYDAGQLRLRLVDPKKLNPDTIMPAFYKTAGLKQVGKHYTNEPILSAQEIEDVISYLLTLEHKGR